MADEINTFNKFMVMMHAGSSKLIIGMPPRELDKADALLLAAWLVCMAFPEDGEFEAVLAGVRST